MEQTVDLYCQAQGREHWLQAWKIVIYPVSFISVDLNKALNSLIFPFVKQKSKCMFQRYFKY